MCLAISSSGGYRLYIVVLFTTDSRVGLHKSLPALIPCAQDGCLLDSTHERHLVQNEDEYRKYYKRRGHCFQAISFAQRADQTGQDRRTEADGTHLQADPVLGVFWADTFCR